MEHIRMFYMDRYMNCYLNKRQMMTIDILGMLAIQHTYEHTFFYELIITQNGVFVYSFTLCIIVNKKSVRPFKHVKFFFFSHTFFT